MRTADKMSNSELIDYLYEEVEDVNDFLSSLDEETYWVELALSLLEKIVDAHLSKKGKK